MNKLLSLFSILTIALLALWLMPNQNAIPEEGQLFFPALNHQIAKVAAIEITTEDGSFLIKKDKKNWRLNNRQTISPNKIRGFLFALSETKIIEPKTKNKNQFSKLGVDEHKPLSQITLRDKDFHILSSAYLGQAEKSPPELNRIVLYARSQNSTQAYLVETAISDFAKLSDWG